MPQGKWLGRAAGAAVALLALALPTLVRSAAGARASPPGITGRLLRGHITQSLSAASRLSPPALGLHPTVQWGSGQAPRLSESQRLPTHNRPRIILLCTKSSPSHSMMRTPPAPPRSAHDPGAPACTAEAEAEAAAEADTMRALRQAVYDADPLWMAHLSGWDPASPALHCSWQYVACDASARVIAM